MNYKIFSKKIITVLCLFFGFVGISYADSCKYQDKIDQCVNAVKRISGGASEIVPGASLKEISDFPCLQDSREKIIYQIVIDAKFKEIDKEMNEFLEKLYTGKDIFFDKKGEQGPLDGINLIAEKKQYFSRKYDEACVTSWTETKACMTTSISAASPNFTEKGNCSLLKDTKLKIFENVAYNALIINKFSLDSDDRIKYRKIQSEKYGEIMDLMMLNLSYVELLWKRWTVRVQNVVQ